MGRPWEVVKQAFVNLRVGGTDVSDDAPLPVEERVYSWIAGDDPPTPDPVKYGAAGYEQDASSYKVTKKYRYVEDSDGAGTAGWVEDSTGATVNIDSAEIDLTGVSTEDKQDAQIIIEGAIQTAVEAIQTAVETLDNAIDGTEMQVDVVSSALPSGAATAANQATQITAEQAIQAAVETIDNAISGSEMQVDVVAALPAGDNNIGNVDLASAVPAGTNLIGKVSIDQTTPGTTNAVVPTTDKTILRAAISAASSGDNTLIAAAGEGIKNKVLGMVLIAGGDVDVRLESGAGGTALTGVISLAADGNGFVIPVTQPGLHWLETGANALLNLELSAAVQVSGFIVYEQSA